MSTETHPAAPDRIAPARTRVSADGQFSALILGFFGAAWFGWAQEGPPAHWSGPLTVAGIVSAAVAVIGAVRTWRLRRELSARDREISRRYGIVVGICYALIVIGNIAVVRTGHSEYIAPWVAFGIGVHFWPLVPVLKDRLLIPAGAAVVAVAVAAVVIAQLTDVRPSAVTGAGTGAVLLVISIIQLFRRRPAR
ncbi:hypothetical protein AB0J86_00250 [Micromonospora sp. NPDC049559]|uniref:hypothetical protein n=1 Tax=Micromonospora sp. NPDC049559 TaxID=3155923 RepID=UPI0034466EDA